MKAIAAMSFNRVIGNNNTIPWEYTEDFKWFKSATAGGVLVMGRKTVESLPTPKKRKDGEGKLPGRSILTLTGHKTVDEIMDDIKLIENNQDASNKREVWLCGGSQIYGMLLPFCTELYLTRIKQNVVGDTFFPEFEHLFDAEGIVMDNDDFTVEKWVRKTGGIKVIA